VTNVAVEANKVDYRQALNQLLLDPGISAQAVVSQQPLNNPTTHGTVGVSSTSVRDHAASNQISGSTRSDYAAADVILKIFSRLANDTG
jgi:hypothetical protein